MGMVLGDGDGRLMVMDKMAQLTVVRMLLRMGMRI